LYRTDSEVSDVKIAHDGDAGTGWVHSSGHQAAVGSGLSNGTAEPVSSNEVDSPLQRDLVRQLQEANVELTKQLHDAQTTASTHEVQAQHELDSTGQKLKVMKEQLMTGQADSEETVRKMLEQATQDMHAKHALERQRVNVKVGISGAHRLACLCTVLVSPC
jgi:hypothetical protein